MTNSNIPKVSNVITVNGQHGMLLAPDFDSYPSSPSATHEVHVHLCDVCRKNEMQGVYSSACGPISFAYCKDCGTKGAEPYGALVAYIAGAYGVTEWDTCDPQKILGESQLVKSTLEVAGKTFDEWVADVRAAIIKYDEAMEEMFKAEQEAICDTGEIVATDFPVFDLLESDLPVSEIQPLPVGGNTMSDKNLQKLEQAKQVFNERDIIFRELANGQLQVDSANFWATSEKWYDPSTDTRGKGINSFIKYLKDNNFI